MYSILFDFFWEELVYNWHYFSLNICWRSLGKSFGPGFFFMGKWHYHPELSHKENQIQLGFCCCYFPSSFPLQRTAVFPFSSLDMAEHSLPWLPDVQRPCYCVCTYSLFLPFANSSSLFVFVQALSLVLVTLAYSLNSLSLPGPQGYSYAADARSPSPAGLSLLSLSISDTKVILFPSNLLLFWIFWMIPWRRAWQPTPIFLTRESHGQRNLGGYSP